MVEDLTEVSTFSGLYDYAAQITGLPRWQVKTAIISLFYGQPQKDDTWDKIIAAFVEEARQKGFEL